MDWNIGLKLLVIRAVDDEAALTLAAGAIGNRLSIYVAHLLARVSDVMLRLVMDRLVYEIIVILASIGFWLTVMYQLHSFSTSPDALLSLIYSIGTGFLLSMGLFGLTSFILLLTTGVYKAAYGRELLFGALLCEVNSHSAPNLGRTPLVVTLHGKQGIESRLRHSLYDHEDCPRYIGKWLREVRGRHPDFGRLSGPRDNAAVTEQMSGETKFATHYIFWKNFLIAMPLFYILACITLLIKYDYMIWISEWLGILPPVLALTLFCSIPIISLTSWKLAKCFGAPRD